jgi:hypothetical protein
LYKRNVSPFGFFFPGAQFQADTNSNLECLRRILESLGAKSLPKKLYIQLDNTCKDNKNYKFLAFCAFLLFAGFVIFFFSCYISFRRYVSVIEIYFLPKGHTHGQIDQMFSCFSQFLKKLPAKTLMELTYSLQLAYNHHRKKKAKKQASSTDAKKDPEVNVQVIESVIDVVSWLRSTEIPNARRNMKLQDSHAFQLQLDSSGDKVLCRSKEWAVNKEWLVRKLCFSSLFIYLFNLPVA